MASRSQPSYYRGHVEKFARVLHTGKVALPSLQRRKLLDLLGALISVETCCFFMSQVLSDTQAPAT